MSQIEYNDLLFEISAKIGGNELPRMRFMCRDKLRGGSEGSIPDVLALFEALEKQNHLGIDRLDTVKQILDRMKKRSLLKKVEDFEMRRKAQSVGIISSVKRGTRTLVGAVKLVCNVRTLAGGIVLVGSGLVLRSCSSFEEYCDAFNKVVLPAFTKLLELREGSLCFTVQAETVSALSELWKMYSDEILKGRLQEFLVTDEVKQLANGEDVELTVFIDEQEYRDAYLGLMLQHNQEEPDERRRRTSDSFLFLSPERDEVTTMKLQLTENKLVLEKEKRKATEQEIRKLKFENEKFEVREREDVERPRERLRRNSDSELYCKAKHIQIRDTEKKRHLFEDEKYAFVQRYLEHVQEMQSITTETSDSGVKSHGEHLNWSQKTFLEPSMACASPGILPTKEMKNFALLYHLVVDIGTDVLRDKFDGIHSPANLQAVLAREKPILQRLRTRKVINPIQWDKLFPAIPSSVSSASFDIILLTLLLCTICGLAAPATGWGSLPAATDTTPEGDIARVNYFRNTLVHFEHAYVDDATFSSLWRDIRDSLVRLGGVKYREAIDYLETEFMDPEK